jgi:hypothetical protein
MFELVLCTSFISIVVAWAGGFIGGRLKLISDQLMAINDKLDGGF